MELKRHAVRSERLPEGRRPSTRRKVWYESEAKVVLLLAMIDWSPGVGELKTVKHTLLN